MDYYFEMVQKLKFSVYDLDNETSTLGDDDFLGDMECNLGQVWRNEHLITTPACHEGKRELRGEHGCKVWC